MTANGLRLGLAASFVRLSRCYPTFRIERRQMKKDMRHKWSINIDRTGRVVDSGVAQCLHCGVYKQYVKGRAEFWRGDNHLPKRPPCVGAK